MTTPLIEEHDIATTARHSPPDSPAFMIPTISLSEKSRQEIVSELRDASLSSGFFQLVDIHPYIPYQLVAQMFEQMTLFFALPASEKEKVIKKDHLVGGYEGFRFYDLAKTGDGGKKGKDEGKGGWNEGFAIAPEWGTNCFPGQNSVCDPVFDSARFATTCKEYFHATQELGRFIMGILAEGLGIDRDFFEPYLDKQNSFCRLTHYYQAKDDVDDINGSDLAPDQDEVEVGAAPHTDWGALTLLIQDTVGGLQVFDRAKEEWHDVPPLPLGTGIVCNIGDTVARWTNGKYISALHRVIAPKRGVHRYSIPFFNPGNMDYLIETIPTCISDGEPARYPPITAGEYITAKHLESTGGSK